MSGSTGARARAQSDLLQSSSIGVSVNSSNIVTTNSAIVLVHLLIDFSENEKVYQETLGRLSFIFKLSINPTFTASRH